MVKIQKVNCWSLPIKSIQMREAKWNKIVTKLSSFHKNVTNFQTNSSNIFASRNMSKSISKTQIRQISIPHSSYQKSNPFGDFLLFIVIYTYPIWINYIQSKNEIYKNSCTQKQYLENNEIYQKETKEEMFSFIN